MKVAIRSGQRKLRQRFLPKKSAHFSFSLGSVFVYHKKWPKAGFFWQTFFAEHFSRIGGKTSVHFFVPGKMFDSFHGGQNIKCTFCSHDLTHALNNLNVAA